MSDAAQGAESNRIEVHVRDLDELFHLLDPAPFYRKLDDDAEEYIVTRARDLPHHAPLTLLIYVDQGVAREDEGRIMADAVRAHFARRVEGSRRELRELFRRGRASVAIGLPFLAATIIGVEVVEMMSVRPLAGVFRESLLIGGWVAMWRPLEIFLYDWWPIRDGRRQFARLARMDVRVLPSRP